MLDEAQKRLKELISEQFKIIAVELENEDIYLYHRAISSGIQEFIEAYTFFNYIKDKSFVHWNYFQDKFEYQLTNESNINEREAQNISKKISLKIVPSDFILGVADLTGELMRKCFKTLSIGDTQSCFEICNFVKNVYCGFLLMGVLGNLELTHKIFTLKQSVLKMEMICYNISVRGNEIYKFKMVGDDNDTAYVYQEV